MAFGLAVFLNGSQASCLSHPLLPHHDDKGLMAFGLADLSFLYYHIMDLIKLAWLSG
jgi:hypothetical protein